MTILPKWLLAACLTSVVLLAGCSSQPEIYEIEASGDGMSLMLMMGSCNGDYRVAVEEDSEHVRVEVTDQRRRSPLWGQDCSGIAGPIQLEQPLGGRVVVDTIHDAEILVTYRPWNQTRYSEAEYRAALEAAGQCIKAAESEAIVTITTSDDGYPFLDFELPDLADGESSTFDPVGPCFEEHVDPLLH